jgi:hypothetical protein
MPTEVNHSIELSGDSGRFSPPMVDHFIRVDRAATERILQSLNEVNTNTP